MRENVAYRENLPPVVAFFRRLLFGAAGLRSWFNYPSSSLLLPGSVTAGGIARRQPKFFGASIRLAGQGD